MTIDLPYIFEQYKTQLKSYNSSPADTWTFMLQMYRLHNQTNEAWELFQEMEKTGIIPTNHTFSAILIVLGEMEMMQEGQRIHKHLEVLLNNYLLCCAHLNIRISTRIFAIFHNL
jgi:pentatricopeptide repeat protein